MVAQATQGTHKGTGFRRTHPHSPSDLPGQVTGLQWAS